LESWPLILVLTAQTGTSWADVLYVSNFQSGTISEVNTVDGSVTTFVSGLTLPSGLTFDPAGNLYVALQRSGVIDKITPGGVVTPFASGLGYYFLNGMAFDSAGNLYVGANHYEGTFVSAILKFNPQGSLLSTWSWTVGAGPSQPMALAFDGGGNLWTADYGNALYEIFPGGAATKVTSMYVNPAGLAFDRSGNLFVANNASGTIAEVTPGGAISTFASGLSGPAGLCFGTDGDLYVGNSPEGTGSTLSRITPDGTVSVFASGLDGPFCIADETTLVPEPGGLVCLAAAMLAAHLRGRTRGRSGAQ